MVIFPNFMIEKSSIGPILTVLDSPETVLYFVPSTNKVAGIVRLIILYHPITGFGLVQRTYMLIYPLKKCYFQISYPNTSVL